jgi:hypothetical protein
MAEEEQIAFSSEQGLLKSGVLWKKGQQRHNWKQRYFVLTKRSLIYYKEKRRDGNIKGELQLAGVPVEVEVINKAKTGSSAATNWRFKVTAGDRDILLAAEDETQMNEWVLAIRSNSEDDGKDGNAFNPMLNNQTIQALEKMERSASTASINEDDEEEIDPDANPDLCKAGMMWKRPTKANAMKQDFQLRYFELLPGVLNYYTEKGGALKGSLEFPNDEDETELKIDILPMNMGVEGKGVTGGTVPIMDKAVGSMAGMIGMGGGGKKSAKAAGKDWQFRLTVDKKEMVVAADTEEELMQWVEAFREFTPDEDDADLNQKAAKIIHKLVIRDRMDIYSQDQRGRNYKQCFTGEECVKEMIKQGLAADVKEAVGLGNRFISVGLMQHVRSEHIFQDVGHLYQFTLHARATFNVRHMLRKGFKSTDRTYLKHVNTEAKKAKSKIIKEAKKTGTHLEASKNAVFTMSTSAGHFSVPAKGEEVGELLGEERLEKLFHYLTATGQTGQKGISILNRQQEPLEYADPNERTEGTEGTVQIFVTGHHLHPVAHAAPVLSKRRSMMEIASDGLETVIGIVKSKVNHGDGNKVTFRVECTSFNINAKTAEESKLEEAGEAALVEAALFEAEAEEAKQARLDRARSKSLARIGRALSSPRLSRSRSKSGSLQAEEGDEDESDGGDGTSSPDSTPEMARANSGDGKSGRTSPGSGAASPGGSVPGSSVNTNSLNKSLHRANTEETTLGARLVFVGAGQSRDKGAGMCPGTGRKDKYDEWQKTGSATGEGAFSASAADGGGAGVIGGMYDGIGAIAGQGAGTVQKGAGTVQKGAGAVGSKLTNPLLQSDLQKTVAKDTKRNQKAVSWLTSNGRLCRYVMCWYVMC